VAGTFTEAINRIKRENQMADKEVTRIGNLTRAPELRFTANGKAVCNFAIAYNEWDSEARANKPVVFYEITVWEQMGENVAETFTKGDRVIVVGRPGSEIWKDKDGVERTRKNITATAVGPDLRWAKAELVKVQTRAPAQQTTLEDEEPF
jgi:single-strand DNA-binding protein